MVHARLIIDPPAGGAWNMAVDEALAESAAAGVASLRFYGWSEPTLSLGYFQPLAERAGHAASLSCPLVRRASGGGAIVHDCELTYSIALPIRERLGAQAAALYDTLHTSLIAALAEWGVKAAICQPRGRETNPPFLCFQRRTRGDVLCGEWKIAGSAQRRQRGALLQHGSVLLRRSPLAPELPGIEEAAGLALGARELANCWAARIAAALELKLAHGELTAGEFQRANRLEAERFGADDWNSRR